jgi:hypothetical protein
VPLVHDELRRIARRHMRREREGHTLQASALVNEAYLRLIELTRVQWQNRVHFFYGLASCGGAGGRGAEKATRNAALARSA